MAKHLQRTPRAQARKRPPTGAPPPANDEAPTVASGEGFKNTNKIGHTNHSGTAKNGKHRADSRTAVIDGERLHNKPIPFEITPVAKVAALIALRDATPGNSATTQEARVLAALRQGPLTTFEAMRFLDVFDPRARVMSLRRAGHAIDTTWVRTPTECGCTHRLGKYVLVRGEAVSVAAQAPLFDGAVA